MEVTTLAPPGTYRNGSVLIRKVRQPRILHEADPLLWLIQKDIRAWMLLAAGKFKSSDGHGKRKKQWVMELWVASNHWARDEKWSRVQRHK
jgi:hypothetical protein